MYLNEPLFSEFLSEKEITWLGVDFSKAKLTKNGFGFPMEVIQHYFHEWNLLIISDQKKYDIRMAFRKPVMHYDLSLVTKKNKSTKVHQTLVEHLKMDNIYTEELIIEYVSELDIPYHSRFNLMVVTESFDHNSKTASLWVVITHSESRKVVLCEKFLKTPAGFGTKNFWARVFYNLFFDIQKNSFIRWVNLVEHNQIIK